MNIMKFHMKRRTITQNGPTPNMWNFKTFYCHWNIMKFHMIRRTKTQNGPTPNMWNFKIFYLNWTQQTKMELKTVRGQSKYSKVLGLAQISLNIKKENFTLWDVVTFDIFNSYVIGWWVVHLSTLLSDCLQRSSVKIWYLLFWKPSIKQ